MPIYEYECEGCHSIFEVRQKVSDPSPTSHGCGSTKVRRILSATSFVLKGTGWYATDYGNRKQDGHATGATDGKNRASDAPADKTVGDGKAAANAGGAPAASKQQSGSDATPPKAAPSPEGNSAKAQSH